MRTVGRARHYEERSFLFFFHRLVIQMRMLVSRGGWSADGGWEPLAYVDEHVAERLFRHKVMRFLQDEGLLNEERTELLLSWRHTGFSVHNRVRVEPEDQTAVERLAR